MPSLSFLPDSAVLIYKMFKKLDVILCSYFSIKSYLSAFYDWIFEVQTIVFPFVSSTSSLCASDREGEQLAVYITKCLFS